MNNSLKKCSGFCTPVIIYVVFALIGMLVSLARDTDAETKVFILIRQLIITLLWTILMYWLCSSCKEGWAWFFLLLPFVGLFLLFLVIILGEIYLISSGHKVARPTRRQ